MKVQSIVTRVRNIAGDVDSLQITDAMIIDWINDGVRECAVQNKLLQKRGTTQSVLEQSDYSLPTDILKMHSVKYDGTKLKVLTLEEFDEYTGGQSGSDETDIGTPQVCYVWAGNLVLYPAPDVADLSLVIDYIYDPEPVTEANLDDELTSLPVEYHSRIVDYCLAQVAQQDDDIARYQIKMEEFRTGVQNIKDLAEQTHDTYPVISVAARDSGGFDTFEGVEW